jgi:hypothetical protein
MSSVSRQPCSADSCIDQFLRESFISHIARNTNGAASSIFDLRDQRSQFGFASRGHDDFRRFLCEQLCRGAAYAGTCAGDNGDFACQYLHLKLQMS